MKLTRKSTKNFLLVAIAIGIFSFLLSTTLGAAGDKKAIVYTQKPVDCSEEAQKARENYYIRQGFGRYNPCANVCAISGSGGDIVRLSGDNNLEKILKYLNTKGFSPDQAAGIAGNLLHESGFSPFRQEDSFKDDWPNGGYGIAKFTGVLRTSVTAKLSERLGDTYTQYYTPDYGSGTTALTGYVPSGLPENINDQFLIVQLDYLYEYLSGFAPEKTEPYVTALSDEYSLTIGDGVTLLDYIKSLTKASDVAAAWAYLYEQKVDAKDIALVRSASAQSILDNYPPQSSDECSSGGGSKQQLAQQILDSGNLRHSITPALEREIIPNIAAGTNDGNTWPCGMNINVLKTLAEMTKENIVTVSSLNRACSNTVPDGSGPASRHYAGNGSAIDFDFINGREAEGVEAANLILQYMAPFLPENSGVGQTYDSRDGSACLPDGSLTSLPPGIRINRFPDYCHHLHVDLPPNSDPDLQCRGGVNYGGCDKNRI